MSGVFSTGKSPMLSMPKSTMTIEMTLAKTGWFMKNLLNIEFGIALPKNGRSNFYCFFPPLVAGLVLSSLLSSSGVTCEPALALWKPLTIYS